DYQDLRDVIILGNENAVPSLEELETILTNPENCLAICTLAIPLADRPEFFSRLLQTLLKLRNELGHPHWVLMDEAHHFLTGESALRISQDEFNNFLLITNSPESLNTDLLKILGMAIVVGENPIRQLEYIGGIRKMKYPASPVLSTGEAYVWNFENELENGVITLRSPGQFLLRHKKKYAHGDLNEKSFYFTGGENRLNLRATNLMTFANLAEGIDDDTWDYHLGRKDFFNWFKTAVNDDELAEVSEKARRNPTASKKMILDFIKKKYTG
ncbi:MAG TPA: hypothetical protein VFW11_14680, partial [Cyclobacteriaceae bacterium]|nr:hypothetical protein [Cyclobacteriaceae bacterium]